MTTLVTGATGLLGSHVTDVLVARDEPVRLLVRPNEQVRWMDSPGIKVCRGDLEDPDSLYWAVSDVDRVINCAARTGPWGPMAEYRQANVRGLRALVKVSQAAGIKRMVHVSSVTVHGNDVHGVADEPAPLHSEPNSYSRTKVMGERIVARLIADGAPVTIVRPGWIYGPRDVASFARFAHMIQQGRMVVFGRGDNHIPLIYVRDVVEGILCALEAPEATGRTYLLVNDEAVTQSGYLGAIAAALGVPPPRRHIPYKLALALGATAETAYHLAHRPESPPIMRYGVQMLGGENRFSIDRARREIGFAPQVAMEDGVVQSVAWYTATHAVTTTTTNER